MPNTRAPDFKRIYSNAPSSSITGLDAQITFSFQGALQPGQDGIEEQVMVSMSIETYAALLNLMQTTYQQYLRARQQNPTGGVNLSGSASQSGGGGSVN
jgi:hypothetical protein